MGGPMAANLLASGHDVLGFDVSGVEIDGVTHVENLEALSVNRDIIITMLPNGEILMNVYKEIVSTAQRGTCFLDCSTIDIDSSKKAHQLAQSAGMLSLDAPVSGGVGGAEAGSLTFMIGGNDRAFSIAEPCLTVMGQRSIKCGAAGNGQAAKICNNMILGISMIGVCEAFNLADRLQLDRQSVFDVVSISSGSCWSMNTYCPAPGVGPDSPADNNYKPGFAANLMLKDLELSQGAAKTVCAETPLASLATKIYSKFVSEIDGKEKDFSAILEQLEKNKFGDSNC